MVAENAGMTRQSVHAKKSRPQALFLDRDGTLIFDKDYLSDPREVELIPGVRDALWRVADSGCKLFLLTNQSGIGRGYFTLADYEKCHARFLELLGFPADAFVACGIAPEAPEQASRYRKPNPAFILEQLAANPSLSPENCWMVGDRASDWQCGLNAKIRSAAVATGKPIDADTAKWLRDNGVPLFADFAEFVAALF
ncbi:MAG: HAD-IIIA family hydrolase [Opitutae bacterium]|nr:HAD-IIIA family hydrolase [Opitutae bacterium]